MNKITIKRGDTIITLDSASSAYVASLVRSLEPPREEIGKKMATMPRALDKSPDNMIKDGYPSVLDFIDILKTSPEMKHMKTTQFLKAIHKPIPKGKDWSRIYLQLKRAKKGVEKSHS